MGSRKRMKPNPAAESSASLPPSSMQPSLKLQPQTSVTEQPAPIPGTSAPARDQAPSGTSTPAVSGDSTQASVQGPKQAHKTLSWYGSWPRAPKSSASTQVARETILGGTSKPKATADFSRFEPKKATDNMSVSETPSLALSGPKEYEDPTKAVNESPNPATPAEAGDVAKPENRTKPEDTGIETAGAGQEQRNEPAAEEPTESTAQQQAPSESTPPRPASGWFSWFGRQPVNTEPAPSEPSPLPESAVEESVNPVSIETKPPEIKPPESSQEAQLAERTPDTVETTHQPTGQDKVAVASGSYWLWSWSYKSTPVPPQAEPTPATAGPDAPPPAKEPEDTVMQDALAAEVAPEPPAPPPKAGSTWAFWSRDTGSASGKKSAQQGEQGQLAVMGESSETHPERATSMEFKGAPAKETPVKSGQKDGQTKSVASASRESSSKSNKRVRPQSMEGEDVMPARPSTPKVETATKPAAPKTPTPVKTLPPNLLLPSFTGTYKLKENPSIIKQIAQLLLRTQQPPAKHVYLTKDPSKIKKAIAIGVHGLFPANYLRPMIGQPTGTSIKFANHCANAIRKWADSHGCEDCAIEKIALEGEGKIGDRVENLWKLLMNWIDHIRNADLILIACHSQGVPVSIMLLAKLIELGIVTSARVGVCAMAGVSLGPFPDYRSSMGILMGTAAELWEFADPQSEVSKRLEASVKAVLSFGARITYVGSIDDQLVPLESAIYAPAHHPYIFRAVFIDGRIHAPDFIAHLVGFALKLRNLGVSDHGLIRELSTPLAGSLYSGEGHSRLYDDEQVYDLAVAHALETTDVGASGSTGGPPPPCEVHHRSPGAAALSNPNPYHLPWVMRGVLEEDFVKTELSAETAQLVRQFDEWKPVTKALKDVKYRLEAVRSKL